MPLDAASLILWSDEHLVVVNKPSGLLSLPDGHRPEKPHLRAIMQPKLGRLWMVHRLDRETSGVMVLARSAEAHRNLNAQFEKQLVSKIYHALVVGNPSWETRHVSLPLRPDGDRRHRTVVDERRGKAAATALKVLKLMDECALVEAAPKTGRPHQIRAHLAAIDYPVVADALYGNRDHTSHHQLERLALHAWSIAFSHPIMGTPSYFEAPYPEDLAAALAP
ncbi:MAG: RluA family pseudouridine synthase [Anaerolineales bacterium]|jgi:RluA family pseudouridine synthase